MLAAGSTIPIIVRWTLSRAQYHCLGNTYPQRPCLLLLFIKQYTQSPSSWHLVIYYIIASLDSVPTPPSFHPHTHDSQFIIKPKPQDAQTGKTTKNNNMAGGTTHHCKKQRLGNCRQGKGLDGKPICKTHQVSCKQVKHDGTVCKKKRQADEKCRACGVWRAYKVGVIGATSRLYLLIQRLCALVLWAYKVRAELVKRILSMFSMY